MVNLTTQLYIFKNALAFFTQKHKTSPISLSLLAPMPPRSNMHLLPPYLKKPSLDPTCLNNLRPLSQLPFTSKLIKRLVHDRMSCYFTDNNLLDPLKSGFRPQHSTETALVKLTNDLLIAKTNGQYSILILLDLSAAFDTADYLLLLSKLHSLGLHDSALSWFTSYPSQRTLSATYNSISSTPLPLYVGVPQDSVLGTLLFSLYTSIPWASFQPPTASSTTFLLTTPRSISPHLNSPHRSHGSQTY